jgi:hypothetical protein
MRLIHQLAGRIPSDGFDVSGANETILKPVGILKRRCDPNPGQEISQLDGVNILPSR